MGRLISNLALTPPRLTATVSITMKPLTIAVLLLSSLCAQNCFAAPTTTARKEAAAPELTFHESWSAEHRAMLTKLQRLIKKDVYNSMLAVAAAMHEFEDTLEDALIEEIEGTKPQAKKKKKTGVGMGTRFVIKASLRPIEQLIKDTATSGKGDLYTKEGVTVAQLAVRLNMPELAKEMVRRGLSPTAAQTAVELNADRGMASMGYIFKEDLLTTIIINNPLILGAHELSQQEAIALLQWFIDQGTDIRKSDAYSISLACTLNIMNHRETRMAEFVIRHYGAILPEQQVSVATFLLTEAPDSLDTFLQLYNEGYFQMEHLQQKTSLLTQVLGRTAPNMPEIIRTLLKLGFDPNYLSEQPSPDDFDSDEEYDEALEAYDTLTPLENLLYNSVEQTDMLACTEILLKAGATCAIDPTCIEPESPLKDKLLSLLKQYNIPLVEETDEEDEEEDVEEEEEEESDAM